MSTTILITIMSVQFITIAVLIGFILEFKEFKEKGTEPLVKQFKKEMKGFLPTKEEKKAFRELKESAKKDIEKIFDSNPEALAPFPNLSQSMSKPASQSILSSELIMNLLGSVMGQGAGVGQMLDPKMMLLPAVIPIIQKITDARKNKIDTHENVIEPFKNDAKQWKDKF